MEGGGLVAVGGATPKGVARSAAVPPFGPCVRLARLRLLVAKVICHRHRAACAGS